MGSIKRKGAVGECRNEKYSDSLSKRHRNACATSAAAHAHMMSYGTLVCGGPLIERK